MPLYDLLKDFAAPIATICAAGAALAVTVYFNRGQAVIAAAQRDIAASQRDIALDKLKHDLFEQRYAIYAAARTLIEDNVRNRHTPNKIDIEKHRELRTRIKESSFFFPSEIQFFLAEVEKACDELFFAAEEKEDASETDPRWKELASNVTKTTAKLNELYGQLPSKFEPAMQFTQMIGR